MTSTIESLEQRARKIRATDAGDSTSVTPLSLLEREISFWSEHLDVRDLGYVGNVFNPNWQGAPQEALDELRVSYEEWDRSYGGGN